MPSTRSATVAESVRSVSCRVDSESDTSRPLATASPVATTRRVAAPAFHHVGSFVIIIIVLSSLDPWDTPSPRDRRGFPPLPPFRLGRVDHSPEFVEQPPAVTASRLHRIWIDPLQQIACMGDLPVPSLLGARRGSLQRILEVLLAYALQIRGSACTGRSASTSSTTIHCAVQSERRDQRLHSLPKGRSAVPLVPAAFHVDRHAAHGFAPSSPIRHRSPRR